MVIDVVVNDSQGNPIHGLKASDFALTENNKLQTVKHFEEHSEVPATDIKIAPEPKLPAGLFTNKTPAPMNGPVNVLLLDYLNTPLTSQPYARKQLLDYLDHAPPGTRIAIFALTTHLGLLQGFTSDMSVLKAALTSKKGAPQTSDILSDPINGGPNGDTTLADSMAASGPAQTASAVEGIYTQETIDAVVRFEDLATSFQEDMIAQYTLNAFDMLARYLIGIPGRKNVIWFSGGFPLDVEPDANSDDPSASVVRNDDEVRKTDNLLARAQVAVYPVDARGLQTHLPQGNGGDGRCQRRYGLPECGRAGTRDDGGDGGGYGWHAVLQHQRADPGGAEGDPKWLELLHADLHSHRHGLGREIPGDQGQGGPAGREAELSQWLLRGRSQRPEQAVRAGCGDRGGPTTTTMATAMMHGGPDPAEILFKVRIRPADTPPEPEPLKTNKTNPDPKVKVEGPYKEYGVDLVPDPHAVSCRQEANGNRHCAIEVWTYVYDRDGQLLVTVGNRIYRGLTPADYAKLLAGGMAFHQEISVPVKGEHYLRTAIHDMVSDRVGAVEIPVAAVARLEPLAPLPAVPATAAPGFTPNGPDTSAAATAAAGAAGSAPAGTPAVSVPASSTNVEPSAPENSGPTLKRRADTPAPPPANPPTAPN